MGKYWILVLRFQAQDDFECTDPRRVVNVQCKDSAGTVSRSSILCRKSADLKGLCHEIVSFILVYLLWSDVGCARFELHCAWCGCLDIPNMIGVFEWLQGCVLVCVLGG